jgi:diguanylate cyclase (GGDEF)-like protein/PAS domain S-box-containing protein
VSSIVIPLRQSAVVASLKQAAFDRLSAPILCISASAQILAVNDAAAELLKQPADLLVGRHLSQVLGFRSHRASARRWALLWSRLLDHETFATDARLPLLDGRRLIVHLDVRLVRVEADNVAVIALTDIAARRAAAQQQRIAQRRSALLAAQAAGAGLLLGADRRVLDVAGSCEQALGVGPEQVVGVPFELLLDDASGAEFLRALDELDVAPLGRLLLRLRARTPGTSSRWVEVGLRDHRRDALVRAVVLQVHDSTAAVEARAHAERLERRLRVFAEGTADLLMVLDATGVIRYQSAGIRDLLGVAPESTLGQSAWALLLPEDQDHLQQALIDLQGDGSAAPARTLLVSAATAQGGLRRLWLALRNYQQEPSIGGVLLTARDVSAALLAEPRAETKGDDAQARRLEYRERLLELAMQTRADFSQSLSQVLRACADTLRASSASFWRRVEQPEALRCEAMFELAANRFARDWVGMEFPSSLYGAYFRRLQERQPIVLPDVAASPLAASFAQDVRWAQVRAILDVPVLLDGEVKGVVCVHQDAVRHWTDDEVNFVATAALMISLALEAGQRLEAESRIEQLAWYDSLTGLPNRNLLRETMRDLIMTAGNRKRRTAVMLIDLDRFKDVNDTLGHLVGDALIKSAAQVLRETVADDGMVARLGGDEFVVLVNEFVHRQEVALLAERIARAMHRTDLIPNVDTQVSASIGVALFPEHGREMSTLLKNADAAMYQAKRDGRNQFSFFNPIRAERAAKEVQLGIHLLKALQADANQFLVEYQPQVAIGSARVVGFEALIRWRHPTFGLLTPDRFIGVAEISGLSERITRWVVNEVCAQITRWRAQFPGFDIPVAINVAGRELGWSGLPILVRASLLKHDVPPHLITLEVTERTLVHEGEINNDVMAELAAMGVGLALDDFGTGYSMLGYLKRMPIQSIKIDQSFVEGVPADADSCAIVHAMLAVARHFRLKVVAEGIETQEQAEYLQSLGCEFAQGFYYARPLPAERIGELLAASTSGSPVITPVG